MDNRGKVANRTCLTPYVNSPLPTAEDRLLFLLSYLKVASFPVAHCALFGACGANISPLIQKFSPQIQKSYPNLQIGCDAGSDGGPQAQLEGFSAQLLAPIKEVPAVKRRAASREHSSGEARRGRGVLNGMEHPLWEKVSDGCLMAPAETPKEEE